MRVGGLIADYNATSWPRTDQVKLGWAQLSWSVGASYGNSLLGSQKSKMTPKWSKNQMSELKETNKMKVVQLH